MYNNTKFMKPGNDRDIDRASTGHNTSECLMK